MNNRTSRGSLGMFVASMLIFGTIGVFRRYIPLPSAFLAFARGILGGLFLLIFVWLKKKGTAEKLPPRALGKLIFSGAMIGLNWMLLFEAYNHTTVAVATLCYYMQPTLVMLLSPLLFREKLTGKKALCACLSLLGMALVSGVFGTSAGGNGDGLGVLLALSAAALYAAVIIVNKKTKQGDAYQSTVVQLLSAGGVMGLSLLKTDGFRELSFQPSALVLLLVVGILHTGIAYALYFDGMEGLSVQSIAVLSYIDPASALLFSAVLLGEPLTWMNIAGAVLIIGSALFSEMKGTERNA